MKWNLHWSQGGGGGACMIIFSLNTQKCGGFNCILIVLDGCAELKLIV